MELRRHVSRQGRVELEVRERQTLKSTWFERLTPGGRGCPADGRPPSIICCVDQPVPRLNIAIHIVGSRGDVQPFIPIAQLLSRPPYNHRVRICTHSQFRQLVEENGIEFFSIGGDPESLMAYMVKNPGLLPGMESIRAGDIGKRRREMAEIVSGCWESCIRAGTGLTKAPHPIDVESVTELFLADAIIANPPSYGHIHCAEKLGIPLHIVFTMPWSPTHEFAHPLASFANKPKDDASALNFHSYGMMEYLAWQGLGDILNDLRRDTLKLAEVSPLWGFILLSRLRVPHSYCWSQALIPKPPDWGDHLSVTGFSFLKLASSYTPPQDLQDFLAAGPPPIYVGFGSIVIDDPKALTDMILTAVKNTGVRAIVSRGWGGIGSEAVTDDIYFIGNCPHDWLFQRVSAVVHHGGAGTTAAGIAAGKPTVIVPFFGDQPFWANMVWRAGAGPKPVPFKQMTAESLTESIRAALQSDVRAAVEDMQAKIATEDGALETVKDFHAKLDSDRIRCHLHPEHVGVWEIKAHGRSFRVSTRALGPLITNNLIDPSQVRLANNIHWDVDEGAEAPIVGLVASAASIVHGIMQCTSAYKERLRNCHANKKPPTGSSTSEEEDEEKTNQRHRYKVDYKGQVVSLRSGDRDDIYRLAYQMAAKRYSSRPFESREETLARRAKRPRALEALAGTAAYTRDLTKVGLRAPVTFQTNFANGCHNMAAFIMSDSQHSHKRSRGRITGYKSGVKVGAKASLTSACDLFASFVQLPREGMQKDGTRGVLRGVGKALATVPFNLGGALSSLSAYTLQGLEREIHKRRLSEMEAELLVIRIRQSYEVGSNLSTEERADTVERWKALTGIV